MPDLQPFKESLSDADREAFSQWYLDNEVDGLDAMITMPESNNPTYIAFNHTAQNDRQLKSWYEDSQPRLEAVATKWRVLDVSTATCETLLAAIVDMGIEEGHYWSGGSSHTFGVAKSTDDQLQCFLREVLPDHNFISGQFLTGIDSKTMQSNRDLFEIAKLVRADEDLSYLVLVVPSRFLMQALKEEERAIEVVAAIEQYLAT